MVLSDEGMAVLAEREGIRLKSYRDSRGIWTIGLGHTSAAGDPVVRAGMEITTEEAWDIFRRDAQHFRQALDGAVKVPLEQHQHDALCSFIYNVGPGAFRRSTLLKRLNAGNYAGAAEAILMWNKPDEIRSRRQGEYEQFLGWGYKARVA